MKKIITITTLTFMIAAINLASQEKGVAYKEFTLGMGLKEIKSILSTKYAKKPVTNMGDKRFIVKTTDLVETDLMLNHSKKLYKIIVKVKYGDLTKIKNRLVTNYGHPNDFDKEKFDSGDKLYLMARWLLQKRYNIELYESIYCRNKKFIPCHIEVRYLDKKLLEEKKKHERDQKEKDQAEKDSKTYDGF